MLYGSAPNTKPPNHQTTKLALTKKESPPSGLGGLADRLRQTSLVRSHDDPLAVGDYFALTSPLSLDRVMILPALLQVGRGEGARRGGQVGVLTVDVQLGIRRQAHGDGAARGNVAAIARTVAHAATATIAAVAARVSSAAAVGVTSAAAVAARVSAAAAVRVASAA